MFPMAATLFEATLTNARQSARIDRVLPKSGPVAQLGARFHGMEEVIGSIPIRSTNKPHPYQLFGEDAFRIERRIGAEAFQPVGSSISAREFPLIRGARFSDK